MTAKTVSGFRNRYILLADLLVIAASAFCAYALRFDWLFAAYREEFPYFLACVLLVKPAVFFGMRLYGRVWRYASVWDLIAIILASSAASLIVSAVMAGLRFNGSIPGFPRSVVPIDWLLTMTFAGGVRMSVRVFAEMREASEGATERPRRALIAGAGHAGVMVVRELQRNPQLGIQPIGFLDDESAKLGKTILGVRVLGSLDALARHAASTKADEVIIALPTAPGRVVRTAVEHAREAGIPSKVIPGVYEMLDGKVSMSRLRNVEISDLLRREQVPLDRAKRDYLRDQVVLVTGGGGSIGSELCRQVAHDEPKLLVLLGHGENSVFDADLQLRESFPALKLVTMIADVRDRGRLEQIFTRFKPDVVFHAAAHKHVPLMEANPEEAITNNVIGTKNVVECAIAAGTDRLVMISTDKAVAPMNVMGASKRLAEMVVRTAARRSGHRFAVVRFGNVLGSRGSVVPTFKAQIEKGGPLTVTHPEMRRFFMTIPEAVHLVLEAGGHAAGGELFVLNMGDPVRIVDLAQDLVELSGFKRGEIPITFTGLRPGEKLDELLWEEGAVASPTQTPDVLRVQEPDEADARRLEEGLSRLAEAARKGDRLGMQAGLAALIPTFVPPVTERA